MGHPEEIASVCIENNYVNRNDLPPLRKQCEVYVPAYRTEQCERIPPDLPWFGSKIGILTCE